MLDSGKLPLTSCSDRRKLSDLYLKNYKLLKIASLDSWRLERGKVRGSFFQVGGRRAEGGVGRKGKFLLPFRNAQV